MTDANQAALRQLHSVISAAVMSAGGQPQWPHYPASYSEWRQDFGAGAVAVYLILLLAVLPLFLSRRDSPYVSIRQPVLTAIVCLGCAYGVQVPVREWVGEGRYPCWLRLSLDYAFIWLFAFGLMLKYGRILVMHQLQQKMRGLMDSNSRWDRAAGNGATGNARGSNSARGMVKDNANGRGRWSVQNGWLGGFGSGTPRLLLSAADAHEAPPRLAATGMQDRSSQDAASRRQGTVDSVSELCPPGSPTAILSPRADSQSDAQAGEVVQSLVPSAGTQAVQQQAGPKAAGPRVPGWRLRSLLSQDSSWPEDYSSMSPESVSVPVASGAAGPAAAVGTAVAGGGDALAAVSDAAQGSGMAVDVPPATSSALQPGPAALHICVPVADAAGPSPGRSVASDHSTTGSRRAGAVDSLTPPATDLGQSSEALRPVLGLAVHMQPKHVAVDDSSNAKAVVFLPPPGHSPVAIASGTSGTSQDPSLIAESPRQSAAASPAAAALGTTAAGGVLAAMSSLASVPSLLGRTYLAGVRLNTVRGQMMAMLRLGLPVLLLLVIRLTAFPDVFDRDDSGLLLATPVHYGCSYNGLDYALYATALAAALVVFMTVALHLKGVHDSFGIQLELRVVIGLWLWVVPIFFIAKIDPTWDETFNSDYALVFTQWGFLLLALWAPAVQSLRQQWREKHSGRGLPQLVRNRTGSARTATRTATAAHAVRNGTGTATATGSGLFSPAQSVQYETVEATGGSIYGHRQDGSMTALPRDGAGNPYGHSSLRLHAAVAPAAQSGQLSLSGHGTGLVAQGSSIGGYGLGHVGGGYGQGLAGGGSIDSTASSHVGPFAEGQSFAVAGRTVTGGSAVGGSAFVGVTTPDGSFVQALTVDWPAHGLDAVGRGCAGHGTPTQGASSWLADTPNDAAVEGNMSTPAAPSSGPCLPGGHQPQGQGTLAAAGVLAALTGITEETLSHSRLHTAYSSSSAVPDGPTTGRLPVIVDEPPGEATPAHDAARHSGERIGLPTQAGIGASVGTAVLPDVPSSSSDRGHGHSTSADGNLEATGVEVQAGVHGGPDDAAGSATSARGALHQDTQAPAAHGASGESFSPESTHGQQPVRSLMSWLWGGLWSARVAPAPHSTAPSAARAEGQRQPHTSGPPCHSARHMGVSHAHHIAGRPGGSSWAAASSQRSGHGSHKASGGMSLSPTSSGAGQCGPGPSFAHDLASHMLPSGALPVALLGQAMTMAQAAVTEASCRTMESNLIVVDGTGPGVAAYGAAVHDTTVPADGGHGAAELLTVADHTRRHSQIDHHRVDFNSDGLIFAEALGQGGSHSGLLLPLYYDDGPRDRAGRDGAMPGTAAAQLGAWVIPESAFDPTDLDAAVIPDGGAPVPRAIRQDRHGAMLAHVATIPASQFTMADLQVVAYHLIYTPAGWSHFASVLQREFCLENLMFLLDALTYRRYLHSHMRVLAKHLRAQEQRELLAQADLAAAAASATEAKTRAERRSSQQLAGSMASMTVHGLASQPSAFQQAVNDAGLHGLSMPTPPLAAHVGSHVAAATAAVTSSTHEGSPGSLSGRSNHSADAHGQSSHGADAAAEHADAGLQASPSASAAEVVSGGAGAGSSVGTTGRHVHPAASATGASRKLGRIGPIMATTTRQTASSTAILTRPHSTPAGTLEYGRDGHVHGSHVQAQHDQSHSSHGHGTSGHGRGPESAALTHESQPHSAFAVLGHDSRHSVLGSTATTTTTTSGRESTGRDATGTATGAATGAVTGTARLTRMPSMWHQGSVDRLRPQGTQVQGQAVQHHASRPQQALGQALGLHSPASGQSMAHAHGQRPGQALMPAVTLVSMLPDKVKMSFVRFASRMAARYIRPDAELCVNLPARTSTKILAGVAAGVSSGFCGLGLFFEAEREILALLTRGPVQRFIGSFGFAAWQAEVSMSMAESSPPPALAVVPAPATATAAGSTGLRPASASQPAATAALPVR